MPRTLRQGAWLSDPNVSNAEIVAKLGYDFVVLDVEHGVFDLAALERFIPLLKGLGLEVLAKVMVPERGPIQQALDFGADGVIIPHVENLAHAERVTAFAKFAPLGNRSLAGGRTMNYGPYDDDWVAAQDRHVKVFPLIEEPGAVAEIEQIAALPTVDGLFVGPGDLSVLSGRGTLKLSAEDFDDFHRILAAARANGKEYGHPAWTAEERRFAVEQEADYAILVMQHAAVSEGFANARDRMSSVAGPTR
jgi:4-hydroxy-2-oxoheptanedioate aldolase